MKLRYVLIVSVVGLVLGLYYVGQNVSHAQQLAAAVLAADSSGQPTAPALKSLADYTHTHMGSSQTVFLASSYQRAQATATAVPQTSGQVYHDAQAACVSKTTAVNQANCVQSYLSTHSTPGSAIAIAPPPSASKYPYTYSYAAPRWTPDLAGLLLVAGALGLLTTAILGLTRRRSGLR